MFDIHFVFLEDITLTIVLIMQRVILYFPLQHARDGLLNRTQTMQTVKETLQRPPKRARQLASPILRVTESTGFLLPQQVNGVG